MAKAPKKSEPKSFDNIEVGKGAAKMKVLREKFGRALDDPDTREAMVRYIQSLLQEDQKKR